MTFLPRRITSVGRSSGRWMLEIVKRTEGHNFVVLPKRRIVERTLAWITRNRRLMPDFECSARSVAVFIRLTVILIMLQKLGQAS